MPVRDKPQRPGRNPKTGEEVPVSARRVVIYKASRKIKDRVEGGAKATGNTSVGQITT